VRISERVHVTVCCGFPTTDHVLRQAGERLQKLRTLAR
jgi:hypothetical protein